EGAHHATSPFRPPRRVLRLSPRRPTHRENKRQTRRNRLSNGQTVVTPPGNHCQAPGLMESFLLGIHRLIYELRSSWHRAEMVRSERGRSRPSECSVWSVRLEPAHPLRRGDLAIINAFPATRVPDQLGFVE